jgi:hypothetical protein
VNRPSLDSALRHGLICAVAALPSLPAAAADIECSPNRIGPGDTVRVLKHDRSLDELAVVRPDGVTWVFLVVGQPPADLPSLMSTEQLADTTELQLEVAQLRGLPWVHAAVPEPVFTEAGRYRLVLSDVLESDEPGAECLLNYDPDLPAKPPSDPTR